LQKQNTKQRKQNTKTEHKTEHKTEETGHRTQKLKRKVESFCRKMKINSNIKRDQKIEIMKRSKASKGKQQRKIELNGSCA
jgi:hypothetical protein